MDFPQADGSVYTVEKKLLRFVPPLTWKREFSQQNSSGNPIVGISQGVCCDAPSSKRLVLRQVLHWLLDVYYYY